MISINRFHFLSEFSLYVYMIGPRSSHQYSNSCWRIGFWCWTVAILLIENTNFAMCEIGLNSFLSHNLFHKNFFFTNIVQIGWLFNWSLNKGFWLCNSIQLSKSTKCQGSLYWCAKLYWSLYHPSGGCLVYYFSHVCCLFLHREREILAYFGFVANSRTF